VAINLTGKYEDGSARAYVVMQDDVQRTDRVAFIAFLRVMRQRDEQVESGTVYISDETFAGAGPDDHARNEVIARAIVQWIAERPVAERYFQLRASLDANSPSPAVALLSETYGRADR
jgi:hypothetical protein